MHTSIITISCSEPSSTFGIQSDLMIFQELECFGFSAITHSFSNESFSQVPEHDWSISHHLLLEQLTTIFSGGHINHIKIGYVPSLPMLRALVTFLNNQQPLTISLDLTALTHLTCQKEGQRFFKEALLPLCESIVLTLDQLSNLNDCSFINKKDIEHEVLRLKSRASQQFFISTNNTKSDFTLLFNDVFNSDEHLFIKNTSQLAAYLCCPSF